MEPEKKVDTSPELSDDGKASPQNDIHYTERRTSAVGDTKVNHAAKLRNPLTGMSDEDVLADVDRFTEERGLTEHREAFRKGALVARHNDREDAFEDIAALSEDEKEYLRTEITHKWRQPFQLYFLVVLCAGSAIVQGMDQAAVNGAQVFYFDEFGIEGEWMQGLINGAPYLCSALIGCWVSFRSMMLDGEPSQLTALLLVQRPSEQDWWPSLHNLYLLRYLCNHRLLDGGSRQVELPNTVYDGRNTNADHT